jgi:hypothetical protein
VSQAHAYSCFASTATRIPRFGPWLRLGTSWISPGTSATAPISFTICPPDVVQQLGSFTVTIPMSRTSQPVVAPVASTRTVTSTARHVEPKPPGVGAAKSGPGR